MRTGLQVSWVLTENQCLVYLVGSVRFLAVLAISPTHAIQLPIFLNPDLILPLVPIVSIPIANHLNFV